MGKPAATISTSIRVVIPFDEGQGLKRLCHLVGQLMHGCAKEILVGGNGVREDDSDLWLSVTPQGSVDNVIKVIQRLLTETESLVRREGSA